MFGAMTKCLFKNWFLTDEAHEMMRRLGGDFLEGDAVRSDSSKLRRAAARSCSDVIASAMSDKDCYFFRGEDNPIDYEHVEINADGRMCEDGFGALMQDAPERHFHLSASVKPEAECVWECFKEWLRRWNYDADCQKDFLTAMLYVRSLPVQGKVPRKEETVFALRMMKPNGETILPFVYRRSAEAEADIERLASRLVPRDWKGKCQIVIKGKSARLSCIEKPEYDYDNNYADRVLEVVKLSIPAASGVSPKDGCHVPVYDWDVVRTKDKDGLGLNQEQWLERMDARRVGSEAAVAASEKCDWWKIDLESLSQDQWVEVLRYRPELFDQCPFVNDFYDVQWCALLRRQPQFADRCPWPLLDEMPAEGWVFLLRKQPQFAERFNRWDEVWSYSWPRLLKDQPQFASHCDWEKLDGWEWASLLNERTEFASRCDWEKLSGDDWAELLSVRPEFAPHCVWEKLSGGNWTRILNCRPEFASHCDWKKLYGFNWVKLLSVQPEFDSHCDWEELDGNDWVGLLIARPEFASHCAWGKLSEDNWNVLLTHGLLMAHPEWVKHFHVWDRLSEMQKMRFLKKSALFCEFVDWEELTLDRRIDYLLLRPEFQDKMDWSDVTDELDWFRLLSVFPQYQKYVPERKGANVDRSYVWIGRCGPIVVIPGGGSYLVDDRQRVGWYEVTPRGICCDKNEHKVKTYMSYQDAKRVVAKIFGEQTGKAYSVVAIDGVYVEADGHQGLGNFATIMKEWLANNVTSIKILYLEYGWAYDVSALET